MKFHRVATVVALAGLTVSCVSNPSPERVARDLIETLASTPEEEECMLQVLEDYDVNDLGADANSGNPQNADPANEELDQFQADLEACRAAG